MFGEVIDNYAVRFSNIALTLGRLLQSVRFRKHSQMFTNAGFTPPFPDDDQWLNESQLTVCLIQDVTPSRYTLRSPSRWGVRCFQIHPTLEKFVNERKTSKNVHS